jgi:hypothetical protein
MYPIYTGWPIGFPTTSMGYIMLYSLYLYHDPHETRSDDVVKDYPMWATCSHPRYG